MAGIQKVTFNTPAYGGIGTKVIKTPTPVDKGPYVVCKPDGQGHVLYAADVNAHFWTKNFKGAHYWNNAQQAMDLAKKVGASYMKGDPLFGSEPK